MGQVFVIMPFGQTTDHRNEEYWSEHFNHFLKPAVEASTDGHTLLGYIAVRSNPAGGGIVGDVFDNLQKSEVVLAELTDFGPSVMYELGIRHTLRSKTILILEEGESIPFYFQNYKIIRYSKKSPRSIREFNLAIERRLREFVQNNDLRWDNPVSDYFKSVGQKLLVASTDAPDSSALELIENGISTVYLPNRNSERNEHKRKTLFRSKKQIDLLAITGHSYLASVGNRFKKELVDSINLGAKFRVILLNPYSFTGLLNALGEISQNDEASYIQESIKRLYSSGDLREFDPINFIEDSKYYRFKLATSIDGFTSLVSEYPDLVDIRFVSKEISATLLLTDQGGFLEPYIQANLTERLRNLMHTFEISFVPSSYLTKTCSAYFNTLWHIGVSLEEYLSEIEQYRDLLRAGQR